MSSKEAFKCWINEVLAQDNPVFYSLEVIINRWLYQYRLNGRYRSAEVMHEAYLRSVKYLDKGNEIGNYSAWFKKVCFNVIREEAKKNYRVALFYPSAIPTDSPLERLELEEMLEKIVKAMQTLEQQETEAAQLLIWRYQQNLSWEAIQGLLQKEGKPNCSVETLRQRGQRARKKLRQIFHDLYSPAS